MRWFLLLLLVISTVIFAVDRYPFKNLKKQQRFFQLTTELRCLVCQNENLTDSTAPLAQELRQQVYRMVLKGDSNEQIKKYLVARYGDFVLFKPRWTARTYFLWLGPFLLLIVSFFILFKIVKRKYAV